MLPRSRRPRLALLTENLRSAPRGRGPASWQLRLAIAVGMGCAFTGLPLRSAHGQLDSARQRPPVEELFVGALAFTQERGEVQVATALATNRLAGGHATAIPADVEFGLTDAIQLEFHGTAARRAPLSGWSTPLTRGASIGITAVRHAWNHGLHIGVSIDAPIQWNASDGEDAKSTRVQFETPALLLGWDLQRVGGAHLFAKLTGAGARCSDESDIAADDAPCVLGVVVPAGERIRITTELPLHAHGAAFASITPGIVWRVSGFELGAAVVAARDRHRPLTGTRLLLVREF
jgi:hypothetical protein